MLLTAAPILHAEDSSYVAETSLQPHKGKISEDLRKALNRVRREYWHTESGRRLLALTGDIPVMERGPFRGPFARYVGGESPAFWVDSTRAGDVTQLEFEVAFILIRQEALLDMPVPLIDAELAAHQAVLQYALEKAETQADFARRLRGATSAGRRLVRSRRKKRDFAEDRTTDGRTLFPGKRPKDVLDRLGFDIYLFSEDPYLFYAAVADSAWLSGDAVTLTELEDFIDQHGKHLDRGSYRALERTAIIERRVYPGRVLRAARIVRDRDGIARIRERLGLFGDIGQKELLQKVNRWLREEE